MDKNRLLTIVERIYDLPTLPMVVNKLNEVAGDPKSCADDIAKIIATDPGLTTKVLKIVNSAFYGMRNSISNISLAVVVLGYKSLRSLALGVSILDIFEEKKTEKHFSIKQLWNHSLAVGICAKILSKKVKTGIVEEQFVCGLLHDIGELLLYKYAYDDFKQVIQLVHTKKYPSFLEAEQNVFDLDHTHIGSWLADKWRLPINTKEAISTHHDFEKIKKIDDDSLKKRIAIIYFADIFCKNHGFHYGEEASINKVPEELYTLLNLPEDYEKDLKEELDFEVSEAEQYLKSNRSKND